MLPGPRTLSLEELRGLAELQKRLLSRRDEYDRKAEMRRKRLLHTFQQIACLCGVVVLTSFQHGTVAAGALETKVAEASLITGRTNADTAQKPAIFPDTSHTKTCKDCDNHPAVVLRKPVTRAVDELPNGATCAQLLSDFDRYVASPIPADSVARDSLKSLLDNRIKGLQRCP